MPNERRNGNNGRDERDDSDLRYMRHREDDLRSVGSPGIGGGTGGYRDRERDDRAGRSDEWSPPQSSVERTARGWGGFVGEGGHAGKGPIGYSRSDSRIHEDVCEQLTEDDHVDASGIEVKCENCEVTLTGTVPSRDMKRRAEQIADSVRGVRDVHNQLRVK